MDSSCENITCIHLHTQQFRFHVSKRTETLLFLSCSSVLKIKITYLCLKLNRSPSYTSTIYFASHPIVRSHTASTNNTDVKRPHRHTRSSEQNSTLFCPYRHVSFHVSKSDIVLQHYCFGIYSTYIKWFWDKINFTTMWFKQNVHIHTQNTYILTWSIFIATSHD
jgi:hypothetical protein